MNQIHVFPAPKEYHRLPGSIPVPAGLCLLADKTVQQVFAQRGVNWQSVLGMAVQQKMAEHMVCLSVEITQKLPAEGYCLTISPSGMVLQCGAAAGAFYGLATLRQILQQAKSRIPCLYISDFPSLLLRGILLDIGRNKIPTMQTLKLLIDRFSLMKINHLELYMEGYCFAWKEYRYLFSDETPVTPEEMRELVRYAAARFIDLVPNLNSLGHMEQWLAKPQFTKFAECENGFDFQGLYHRAPGTIDPQNKEAVQWVYSLYDELVQHFDSAYLNVNLDEPFELGKGKNAKLVKEQGAHAPYLLHVESMHRYCEAKNKKMLMWGDVLLDNPDIIPLLPKDVTVLHWMYEGDGRFAPAAEKLQKSGLNFVLCPGTSCWCSFTGRSDRMLANITDAVNCAVRYNARGILLTDWGDLGHWQYISASYIPFAIGAGMAWAGCEQPLEEVFAYCNRVWFGDESGQAASIFYQMGNYYKWENAPLYSTTLCSGIMASKHKFEGKESFPSAVGLMLSLSRRLAAGMDIPIQHPDIRLDAQGLRSFMAGLLEKAQKLNLTSEDGALVQQEMLTAGRWVLHGLALYASMAKEAVDDAAFQKEMRWLFENMEEQLQQHFACWASRNRTGGYGKSSEQLLHLMRVYRQYC